MKKYLTLFLVMLKIGALTFGGGYAMISVLEHELVSGRKWITEEEFSDMVAIAESTPGPIAINAATFVGYKTGGVLGSALATLAVCIPSFMVIYLISLFFDKFLSLTVVSAAFKGIQAGVIFMIFTAGAKMFLRMKKSAFNLLLFALTFGCMVAFWALAVNFSSLYYILIGAAAGAAVYVAGFLIARKRGKR